MLPSAVAQVGASTVNRKLAAVSAFYAHQARNSAEVGICWPLEERRAGRLEAVLASWQGKRIAAVTSR